MHVDVREKNYLVWGITKVLQLCCSSEVCKLTQCEAVKAHFILSILPQQCSYFHLNLLTSLGGDFPSWPRNRTGSSTKAWFMLPRHGDSTFIFEHSKICIEVTRYSVFHCQATRGLWLCLCMVSYGQTAKVSQPSWEQVNWPQLLDQEMHFVHRQMSMDQFDKLVRMSSLLTRLSPKLSSEGTNHSPLRSRHGASTQCVVKTFGGAG